MSIQNNDTPARGIIKNIFIPVSPILRTVASPPTEPLERVSITSDEQKSPPYIILLDSVTTFEISYDDLIKESQDDTSPPKSPSNSVALEGIHHFLRHDSKVTMDHKGKFHKGYINYSPENGVQFIVRRNARSRKVDFSVPLPDFKQHWTALLGDDRLFPGHSTVSSFLKSATSEKNDPSLNYVSAKHLLSPCPPSLCKALDTSNPDQQVWMDSYNEEKQGLIDHEVYKKISKNHYLSLRRACKIPKAVPSMCVLVVKKDKDGKPPRAKYRIVVFGNFEYRIYQKSQRYSPLLKYSSHYLLSAKSV